MVVLAIIGAARLYSPIPFYDMWDGYINFYLAVEDGKHGHWWAQHNEHRLVLARLLFWLDHRWFGGAAAFVLYVTYALVAAACLLFCAALRRGTPRNASAAALATASLLVVAWLFQWMQEENLTWAFQVQFFLAYVLPLAALLAAGRSAEPMSSIGWFVAACVLGVASVGTMANGLLTLPLLAACAIALRLGRIRVAVLAALAVAAWLLYFHDYRTPPHHGTAATGWGENPARALRYMLAYLGSPVYHLVDGGRRGLVAAQLAGLGLVATAIVLAWKLLPRARERPLATALLFFFAYVAASAAATAGSRLSFGLDTARVSRYTTAALMGWAAIGVAWLSTRPSGLVLPRPAIGAIVCLCAVMFWQQLKAFDPPADRQTQWEIGALALAMGVRDESMIGTIFPRPDSALEVAARATRRGVSIFGSDPYRKALEPLGRAMTLPEARHCAGGLDMSVAVPGTVFRRVHGWILEWPVPTAPTLLHIVDGQGLVDGYALSGGRQRSQEFTGYVRAASSEWTLVRDDPPCRVTLRLPKG
jgi:hypothetical protein